MSPKFNPISFASRILAGRPWILTLAIVVVLVGTYLATLPSRLTPHRASSQSATAAVPLVHQAYVWQRHWDGRVQQAITTHGTNFDQLMILAAEVAWQKAGGPPAVTRVDLDYDALRAVGRPIGLALRIGYYSGPFAEEARDPVTRGLTQLAQSLVEAATSNGLNLVEFQIDFDCAESNLAGYRRWLLALRRTVAPLSLTITALPAWLPRREFKTLLRELDSYVLQVHSFEAPRDAGGPSEICPVNDARRWVLQAGRLGQPFRVALPSYGYRLSYDASGRYLGLNAEGPEKIFPGAKMQRELRAEPVKMAGLVHEWSQHRPTGLKGVLWYRLPVRGDTLKWSWRTLSEVIAGRAPHTALTIHFQQKQPGLFELHLTNDGTSDYHGAPRVRARWNGPRWIAADGLAEFQVSGPFRPAPHLDDVLDLTPPRPIRLPAGESRWIGWLRLQPKDAPGDGATNSVIPAEAFEVELR